MAIGREKPVPCHRFGKGGGKVEPLQGSIGLTCEIAFRLAPEDLRRRAAFRDPTRQLSLAAVWGHEPRNHFFHTCAGGAEIVFPEGEERRQAFPHFLLDMRHRRAQAFVEGDAFRPAQIQPGQGGEGRVVIGVVGPFGHLGVFGEKQVLRCQLHRSARLICEAALQPNALRRGLHRPDRIPGFRSGGDHLRPCGVDSGCGIAFGVEGEIGHEGNS
jgi:hypothetical protein